MTEPNESINPFASPALPATEVEIDTTQTAAVRELRAFVGRKADYYLAAWARTMAVRRQRAKFNWAAFFLSVFWFPYRKMYARTLVLYGVLVAESLFVDSLNASWSGDSSGLDPLDRWFGLLVSIVCGMCGNGWYLAHAKKIIAEERRAGLEGADLMRRLTNRGGTSLVAGIGIFVAFFVVFMGYYALQEGL